MKTLISVLLSSLIGITSFAASTSLTAASGDVNFVAVGKPGFLKIRGKSMGKYPTGSVKVENGNASGEFEFDLKTLDTSNDLRNEHMKDKYLEVGKYPTAKLSIKNLPITDAELSSTIKKSFTGALTLHNVTKDITGNFEYNGKDKKLSATFTFKVSDYKIDIPKYLGVTVSETVDTEVAISFK